MNARVGLFDGNFSAVSSSASTGGDNLHLKPKISFIQRQHMPITFYTDMMLDEVLNAPKDEMSVAWLLEPPSLSDTHYKRVMELFDRFKYILTFDRVLVFEHDKILYYPLGGTWIAKSRQGAHVNGKLKNISIITTDKQRAMGHRLRHAVVSELVEKYEMPIDVYGRGSNKPVASKAQALDVYRYSIVIESCVVDGYFSEKLIDCLSMGTIPIYWGDPGIGEYFDDRGIIMFDDLNQLTYIVLDIKHKGKEYYDQIRNIINVNYHKAQDYMIVEDTILRMYPFLFEV